MVEFETSRGCPTASYFLLLVQKKVTKVNDTPCHGLRLPCATRPIRRLRNSGFQPSNSPRRKLLISLRCSAWQQGIESQNPLITTVILSKAKNPVFGRASISKVHCAESKKFHTANYVKKCALRALRFLWS